MIRDDELQEPEVDAEVRMACERTQPRALKLLAIERPRCRPIGQVQRDQLAADIAGSLQRIRVHREHRLPSAGAQRVVKAGAHPERPCVASLRLQIHGRLVITDPRARQA